MSAPEREAKRIQAVVKQALNGMIGQIERDSRCVRI